jgi:phage host-nuclease inhibitor protein Gam
MTDLLEPIKTTDQAEAFHIDSDDKANWLLRKLANLEAEKQRIQAQAAQIVKQLDAEAESLRYLYEPELQEYVRRKLAANGHRRKSVAFLQGTCACRTVPAAVKIADGKAALEYAESDYPATIRTLQTLDLTAYRERAERVYAETGELLPGVDLTTEHESFSIRFGKPEA